MKLHFKNIILLLVAVLQFVVARADENTTFEVNTPLLVSVGEPFRVEFTLTNGDPDKKSFEAPDFAGLDVLAGPTESTSSSFS